jgi:DNA-binding transcriptional ArsR family regulator
MDTTDAVSTLAALAQEHRLGIFRMLVKAGPDGMAAGAIAEALGLPASSLSFHLAHLSRDGLIVQRRESRSLIYSADFERMNALITFLMEDCCQGRPEVCGPLAEVASRSACCPPSPKKRARS